MEVRLPRFSAVQKKVMEAVPLQSVEHAGRPGRRHDRLSQRPNLMDIRGSASLPATGRCISYLVVLAIRVGSNIFTCEDPKEANITNLNYFLRRNRSCSSASRWGGWRIWDWSSRGRGSRWWRRPQWLEAAARPSSSTRSARGSSPRTPDSRSTREWHHSRPQSLRSRGRCANDVWGKGDVHKTSELGGGGSETCLILQTNNTENVDEGGGSKISKILPMSYVHPPRFTIFYQT